MRLKMLRFDRTRSTVVTITLWDSEMRGINGRMLSVLESGTDLPSRLHALLLIAHELEGRDAAREESKRSGEVHQLPNDTSDHTKEPVSL